MTVTDSPDEQLWQALLRHAGRPRTPHFLLDDTALAPLRETLARLGQPQDGLRIVHVAGSKGKGSTALYLERLLHACGFRVATFTSPHLQTWRERFRVHGRPVAAPPLIEAANRVRLALDGTPEAASLGFFPRLTAIALTLFADVAPDWVLLETGVGGRYDATNVVHPVLCLLTRMELEHCDVLGDTLIDIAAQKAGILKPGVPVVCAVQTRDALDVITREAHRQGAALSRSGHEFHFSTVRATPTTQRVEFQGKHRWAFELSAGARALAENAALGLAACESLGITLRADAVETAFSEPLPGRCEYLPGTPPVLIDSAHTPASFDALQEAIEALGCRRLHLLVACSSERHVRALSSRFDSTRRFVVTCADPDYSVPPRAVGDALRNARPGVEILECADLARAIDEASRGLGETDLLGVTGSTYLAGRARTFFPDRIAAL